MMRPAGSWITTPPKSSLPHRGTDDRPTRAPSALCPSEGTWTWIHTTTLPSPPAPHLSPTMPPLSGCWVLLLFSAGVQAALESPSAVPEHVHLSYPGEPGSMTVTWTTWVPARSEVQFGVQLSGPLPLRAQGFLTTFVDGGILKRKIYIHRVTLRKLLPGVQYIYRCGSAQGWSRRFRFRALKNGVHWSPRLAVFGDMGADNAKALPRLRRDTQQGMYDAILHVGDFAYNMDQDNARVGDRFMQLIEPVAASLPYMTCPGNHEQRYNFSNYKARFSMPGNSEGLWYSWDLGPAHIISFSTEVYFFLHYGRHLLQRQFRWLESDLQKANKNRAARPWIITMGHRPMYCSNADLDDCTKYESKVRRGLGGKYGLEDLFYKHGVDLELWAHEHSYERLWPIYNYQVFNGSLHQPYTHPRGPVHIITGSAGCEERLTPFTIRPRPWSAVRVKEYGYTRMHILNGTHIHIQQVSDDQDGKIVDDFWLVRPLHGRMVYL
ncbi:acid phosphatase type 7 isoform X4 [Fukomys damarensis]|uniref:acid phosphatase type 7 isoform X4 n=1 Tax=Fukomys damarensis TaxID=885580 RepID=UPI00054021EF|nr:acid phosphatase type 7 isoform X4 [Fukomys damarensis]